MQNTRQSKDDALVHIQFSQVKTYTFSLYDCHFISHSQRESEKERKRERERGREKERKRERERKRQRETAHQKTEREACGSPKQCSKSLEANHIPSVSKHLSTHFLILSSLAVSPSP